MGYTHCAACPCLFLHHNTNGKFWHLNFFCCKKLQESCKLRKLVRRAPLVFTSFHLLFCVIPEWNRFRDTECDRRQKGPLPPHRRRGEARMQASCMATAFPIKFRSRPLILDRTEEAGQGAIHSARPQNCQVIGSLPYSVSK